MSWLKTPAVLDPTVRSFVEEELAKHGLDRKLADSPKLHSSLAAHALAAGAPQAEVFTEAAAAIAEFARTYEAGPAQQNVANLQMRMAKEAKLTETTSSTRQTAGLADAAAAKRVAPQVIPQRHFLAVPQATAWLFDWDDNILNMRTSNIYVFHKETGAELAIPTDVYAEVRREIGYTAAAPGRPMAGKRELDGNLGEVDLHAIDPHTVNWSHFYHRATDRRAGSFRDFSDLADPERFDKDVTTMMARPDGLGPVFADFVRACSTPETAQYTGIITARGHDPETIQRVLIKWQKAGIIEYVPPVENIYTCDNAKTCARLGVANDPSKISEIKFAAIAGIIAEIQALPLRDGALAVLDKDGQGKRPQHLVGFSDDDGQNEAKVEAGLGALLRANPERFDKVKITVFGTGKEANIEILGSDGSRRPPQPEERQEAKRIIEALRE